MKLTMAEYYTPNGRNIHKKGITPDVEVEYQQDENNPNADNQLDAAFSQTILPSGRLNFNLALRGVSNE